MGELEENYLWKDQKNNIMASLFQAEVVIHV